MNKTLMRISTLALLLMVSMGTWATVGITGTWAYGNIVNTGEADAGNGDVTVTLTVTPDNGFYIRKSDIKLTLTVDAGTRADLPSITQLNGADVLVGDDPDDPTQERTYSITTDANIIINIDEANFRSISPVIVSESADNPICYFIQSYSNEAFYLRTDLRNPNKINTSNIVTENSEWYFMDASVIDGTQYFYIVHKSTNKYLWINSTTPQYGDAPTTGNEDKYRFFFVKNSGLGAYNIIPKSKNTFSLRKKDGNSKTSPVDLHDTFNDELTCWNFISKKAYAKTTVPFKESTLEGNKYDYQIQNNNNQDLYMIPGTTYVMTSSTFTDENKRWYFVKAEIDDPYLNYYYIIHKSGKYLRYRLGNVEGQDNAVELTDYNPSEQNRFLFIIVPGSNENETHASTQASSTYCIVPKNVMVQRSENTVSLSTFKEKGSFNDNNNKAIKVFKERDGNMGTHWNFISIIPKCETPVIAYSETENDKIQITCATEDVTIYYNINSTDNPTTTSTPYGPSDKITITDDMTIVKAYAVKNGVSEDDYLPSNVTTFNLTVDTPIITYDASTNQVTISSTTPGATIYYTTDGTEPTTASGSRGTTPVSFELSEIVATVRAFAQKGGATSTIVTKACIKQGSDNPVMLQSVDCTDFYAVVGDVSGSNITVNTSSLPQAGMSWYFEDAGTVDGIQYYYICSSEKGTYLQRSGDNLYLVAKQETDAFKFNIVPYFDNGNLAGYNIHSKAVNKFVHKANGNGTYSAVYLNAYDYETRSRWNIISVSDRNFPSPITDFSERNAYYTIASSAATGFFMTTPTGTSLYVTTSAGESDSQKWYFQNAGSDGWATFYYIQNAVTGEALYFCKNDATGSQADAFVMKPLSEKTDEDADRYMFTIANTVTAGDYYIVPKLLAHFTKTNYTAIWCDGTNTLRTYTTGNGTDARNDSRIRWQFTEVSDYVAAPLITYNPQTNKATIISTTPGAIIHYTITGDTPTSSDDEYPGEFMLTEGVKTIMAIAVKGGLESNPTSYSIKFQPTIGEEERPYLIQSYDNAWSTGERNFYLIPNDVNNGVKLNTSPLLRASMEWLFIISEPEGYYNIKNKSTGVYIHYDSTNGFTTTNTIDVNDNGFKFSLDPYPTTGTSDSYNIRPYGVDTNLHKSNGNTNNADIVGYNNKGSNSSRWNFILKKDVDTSLPIEASSDENGTYYYQIRSNMADDNNYYIASPSDGTVYATVSNTAAANNKTWFFKEASNDGWVTYFNIVCAETGEYLYCTAAQANTYQNTTGNPTKTLEVRSPNTDDNSLFIIVKSYSTDAYYITPKLYKDTQLNIVCSLVNRENKWLLTDLNRNSRGLTWKFEQAEVVCAAPIFTEDTDGNIIITCVTPASEIRYTTDGSDPAISSPEYANETTEAQILIKAIAKLKNDDTDASNSEIVTLVNMPDIALSQTSYTYDGTAHEPSISKVSITATEGETKVTTGYSVAYSDNTDAGTATVTLTDDTDDNTYIWHASTTFTINPATLTITAEAKKKIYGEDDPELTYTNEGVVTGESLTDILTGSLNREEGEDVGEYAITQETLELTSTNYTLEYTGANFTISEKSIGEGGYDPASDITLDIIKNDNGTYNVTLKDGESELISGTEGTDYDFSQSEITDDVSGYYHYHSGTITGANNYTGSLIFSYVDVPFSKADGKSQEAGTFVITSAEKGDYATPSGMTAYIVTGISGNTLEVEALEYIPNGVPVLLLSDAAADGFFVHPKGSEETADVTANILDWENEETHFVTAQIYVLYKGEFVLNIDGNLPAGRVYLPKSSVGVGGARLSIARSRATGIESVPEEQDAIDRWYSIDGRRLSGKPTKKGLYIKNGHKVVIK